jgi:aminopeptidase N
MSEQKTVYLSDYQPYSHVVESVDLTFRLAPAATRVLARLAFRPNPARPGRHDLRLDGEKLKLLSCRVDGQAVTPGDGAGH